MMAEPSKVLHVRNVGHEISENDLLKLVQQFGSVTKLVMLRAKNQALLQMHDVSAAIYAIQYYSTVQPTVRGRNVYIQFSSHQELTTVEQPTHARQSGDQDCKLSFSMHHNKMLFKQKIICSLNGLQVHYNNERSRDFTNPSLPSEQKSRIPAQANAMSSFGETGSIYRIQPTGSRHVPFQQIVAQPMVLNSLQMPVGFADAVAAAFGGILPPGITGTNDRCTILVSNLNTEKIDEDKLFNLFSIYGNIIRIKILRNKPDHALIQMGDGLQAELAVHYLKGAMLFDKRMEVNYSKHPQVTSAPDTRDYSTSKLNRFNRNMVKNYRYCCAPTKMIHISSLPPEVTEDEIISHLEPHGNVVNSKLFEINGKKQALVLFENEEQSTEALVSKHATTIDGLTIRISFSQLQSIQSL